MWQASGPLDLESSLQLQLCPPPVSPLGIVPDCVSSSHPVVKWYNFCFIAKEVKSKHLPDPLRNGPVLLALLGQDALHPERLQGRHGELQEAL